MKKKRSSSGGGSRNIDDEGIKILFICYQNQRRSPTAEKTWNRRAGVSARSAGIGLRAKQPVAVKDILWADYVMVMEEKQKNRLAVDFDRALKDKQIHVLNIAEGAKFMDPDLVAQFEADVAKIIYP